MTRTITLMTTARAKGAELPAEWWGNRIVCPRCGERSTVMVAPFVSDQVWCRKCDGPYGHGKRVPRSRFPERKVYIGPDLELPENIHHAFTVADALNEAGPVEVTRSGINEVYRFRVRIIVKGKYGKLILHEATAHERHLAIVAACEAALGIQHEKEIVV